MKPLFLFINAILIIFIAYFCVQIFYKHIGKRFFEVKVLSQKKIQPVKQIKDSRKNSFEDYYKKIKARNLFKVQLEKKDNILKSEKDSTNNYQGLQGTELDLTLWGTVIGTNNTYAVIEDNENKVQSLYQTGDKLKEAVIKKILRDKVVLKYRNQDYILEMDIKQMPDTMTSLKKTNTKPTEIIVKKSLMTSSLKDIDDLKRQVRIKPIITKGKPDGLLFYSIKPDSFFHTLGLQNGDIIKQVNGKSMLSFEDAAKIYQNLGNASKVKVAIFRNGKIKDLIYHIKADDKTN